jgi:hypothetical protein
MDAARAVGADLSSGSIWVTGQFHGSVNFGTGAMSAVGGADVFLAKLSSAGAGQWAARFGGDGTERGTSLSVDSTGDVLIGGDFQGGMVNFGGSPLAPQDADGFAAMFTASGTHIWSNRIGGPSIDAVRSVWVRGGQAYAAGTFTQTADFGGGAMTATAGDGFVVSFSTTNGAYRWANAVGGPGSDSIDSVAVGPNGDAILTGAFTQTVDFGDGSVSSVGNSDIFLVGYAP